MKSEMTFPVFELFYNVGLLYLFCTETEQVGNCNLSTYNKFELKETILVEDEEKTKKKKSEEKKKRKDKKTKIHTNLNNEPTQETGKVLFYVDIF